MILVVLPSYAIGYLLILETFCGTASRFPCIQPFIPWYYGINKISPDFEKETYQNALRDYNIKEIDYKNKYPGHACWVFDDFATKIDSCYHNEIESVIKWKTNFETGYF